MKLVTPFALSVTLAALTASAALAGARDTAILLQDGEDTDTVFVYDPDGIDGVQVNGAKSGSVGLKHYDAAPKRTKFSVERLFDGYCFAPLQVQVRDGAGNEQTFQFSGYGALVQVTAKTAGNEPVFSFKHRLPAMKSESQPSVESLPQENIYYAKADLVYGPGSRVQLSVVGELDQVGSSGLLVVDLCSPGPPWRFEVYVEQSDPAAYSKD